MLDSLGIRNYRNLKDLRIKSLGRINLITGKNNTGKSAILEAVAIYASEGDMNIISALLEERGGHSNRSIFSQKDNESNVKTLSSMFNNYLVNFEEENIIYIGSLNNNLPTNDNLKNNDILMRFVKYIEETQRETQNVISKRIKIIRQNDVYEQVSNFKIGFEIKSENKQDFLSLDNFKTHSSYSKQFKNFRNFQFITSRNINKDINSTLWANITLTDKEKYVIEALQIIEPLVERITFIDDDQNERIAVVKLSGNPTVLPLRSMGDGINRILNIILALVNTDGGYLLIDEIENGLHYTVQEQLWKIIFSLAEKLDIQVFATTHSEDCIRGFEAVLNSAENNLDGKLIRLDNVGGIIKQVEYSAEELKIATDNQIETR